jgi:polysaccharide chain length determinant protein (PEP-CTERM system associated)
MIDIDFKFYLSLFWRRLPLFLLVWVTIATIGLAAAYLLPSIYKSEARILVESQQISGDLVDTTVDVATNEAIQSIKQRVLTRSTLLDLDRRFDALGQNSGFSPTERVEIMNNSIEFEVLDLGGQNTPRGARSATAFTVAFYSESAYVANQVAQELVTMILARNIEDRAGRAGKTKEFFKQELDKYSNLLADVESQIVIFKNNNSDALPDSLEFRREEMSRIQARLRQIDSQELTLLEQRDQLQRTLENPSLLASIPSNRPATAEERALNEVKREIAQKSTILSESHPQMLALRAEEKALTEIVQGTSDSEDGTLPALGAKTREVEDAFAEVKGTLSFLAQQRQELESQLARLAKSIEQTPTVEMSLNNLYRTQEQYQSQYDLNLERFNTADTGVTIELQQQGERFEVIEQASVPDEPISPNRILLGAGAIFGGIAAGLGLIVLLEMLNTSIRRPVELTNHLGIKPFATVPYIATKGETLRRRLKAATSILAVAICVPTALYLIHYHYMPIDLILSKVVDRFGLDDFTRRIFS